MRNLSLNNSYLIFLLGVVIFICALTTQVQCSPITFNLTGNLTHIIDPNSQFNSSIYMGQTLGGSVTFESTTSPSPHSSSTYANYQFDSTSFALDLIVGDYTFSSNATNPRGVPFSIVKDGNIEKDVFSEYVDSFYFSTGIYVSGPIAGIEEDSNRTFSEFWIESRDYSNNPDLINSSNLPLVPPDLSKADNKFLGISINSTFSELPQLYLRFGLTSLSLNAPTPVPEPSTIVLMGLGLVGLAGFGRKKFKK